MRFYDRVDNRWTWVLLISLLIINTVVTWLTVGEARFVVVTGTT